MKPRIRENTEGDHPHTQSQCTLTGPLVKTSVSKGPHPANMSLRLANEPTLNRRDTLTSEM